MQRRFVQRARTDFSVRTLEGSLVSRCRGIEISPTGILLDRGRAVTERDARLYLHLEISLPERHRKVRAIARPVWSFGTQQALKFISIDDADRLTLAEHVDLAKLRGQLLN